MDVDIKVLCCGADSKFFAVDVDTGVAMDVDTGCWCCCRRWGSCAMEVDAGVPTAVDVDTGALAAVDVDLVVLCYGCRPCGSLLWM